MQGGCQADKLVFANFGHYVRKCQKEVDKIKETYQNKIDDLKNKTDRALTKRLNSTKKKIRNKLKLGE